MGNLSEQNRLNRIIVKRKELSFDESGALHAGEHQFNLNGTSQVADVLNLAVLQKKSIDFADEAISHAEALAMSNRMLQTNKFKDEPIAVYYDDKGFAGISDKIHCYNPVEFLDKVEGICDKHKLTIGKVVYAKGYMVYCNIEMPMEMGLGDVYKPSVVFTSLPRVNELSLGLWRLACTNGAIVKVKGTTQNLSRPQYFPKAEMMIKEIIANPDEIYAPVKQKLYESKLIPASLGDLKTFRDKFVETIGEERANRTFRLQEAFELYPTMPETPTSMWMTTAPIPMSVYDLYNIGTNIATHHEGPDQIQNAVFLQRYLFQSKPLESLCTERPAETDLFKDLKELRGESDYILS